MARDNGYDTTFNPSIAALGMPQTNEISAIGKTITDFGKVLQDNEDAELKRKALNTNIAESEQRQDFASKLFPKQMEEYDLKNAGQTTANKANELQYKSADELWRDKKATDYLQSYIKSNGLKQEDLPTMLKNREQNPDQFKYKDHTGAEYDLSPNHITSAFDAINKQNLETEGTKAKIAESKADAFYKHAAGKAALISAGANAERAANGGKHNISVSSLEKIAQNAANTSTVANSFMDIANYYDKSRVGPLDYATAWATNKVGINTEGSKNTMALNASIESLIGAVKDIYAIKGNVSNVDMQRIQSMAPSITDSEDTFKEKTMRLMKTAKDGYKSKLETYDPEQSNPVEFKRWEGNYIALVNAEQQLQKKFGISKPQMMEDGNQGGARSIKPQTEKKMVKQWVNPATKQTKILYSDGTTEIR